MQRACASGASSSGDGESSTAVCTGKADGENKDEKVLDAMPVAEAGVAAAEAVVGVAVGQPVPAATGVWVSTEVECEKTMHSLHI